MRQPLLSIVMPVYNVESYLDVCLDSMLANDPPTQAVLARMALRDALGYAADQLSDDDVAQILDAFEVVAVDDGSTDGSRQVLERWARDGHVRIVERENGGVSAARNSGIDAAQGSYVAFVDADDAVMPSYLPRLLAWCYGAVAECESESPTEPAPDIFVFSGITVPEVAWQKDTLRVKMSKASGTDECIDALLTRAGSTPWIWNKAFRCEFLQDNGLRFDSQLWMGEDCAFAYATFAAAQEVAYRVDQLYLHRTQRDSSAMGEASPYLKACANVDVLDAIARDWQQRGVLEGRRAQLLAGVESLFREPLTLKGGLLMSFCAKFAAVFAQHFDKQHLLGLKPLLRARYDLFLRAPSMSEVTVTAIARSINAGVML